ncbi:Ribosomal RNA small subunit methyltransferase J [Bacillus sp. THAF10]|uniref:class I SAM-dependent methyltransferase n=1 Tax=Bacillus sp. THAF10 TaxID=2587848 RepID=UPI001267B9B0|nr:class I SAM-dependent methyltransferase [Bacillus sp. THAF10]QFT89303.1 Ribosomal RNA small subunit methyltransferase J [Bacillus sp. THAF10]
MIVTTAGRTDDRMVEQARSIAKELTFPYIARNKKSIDNLGKEYQSDVLVIGKNRYEWHRYGDKDPLFFHPNSASFRVKRWMKGEHDPFITAARLEPGMSMLDCTLGLASDSIIASLAAGEKGEVVGIEGNSILSFLVKSGLKNWESENTQLKQSMRRIHVIKGNFIELLSLFPDNAFDVVYLDPMFEKEIADSSGIRRLSKVALYDELTVQTIEQAKRVASKRVVMKDHWQSHRFEAFGFQVLKRKTSTFHFGFIEV